MPEYFVELAKLLEKILMGEMRTGLHEGLFAKKFESPYSPGGRGKRYLKIARA